MKKILILFVLAFILLAAPAMAQEEAKGDNVPFRTDSGLITAEYYLATGKYTQALRVLAGVLQRHPQNADAYAYSGYAWQKLDDPKKAAENYQTALNIDPTHLGAQKYLGNIHLAKGDIARAMESLQALKITCGLQGCAEMDELESDINRFKKSAK
jgi:Tfp pilus assembly protein PilF